MKSLLLFLALLTPLGAKAQWTQIATVNATVAITGSVTTFVRYGSVKDDLWVYKAYSSKTFVVGSKEYTISPDPSADPSTFVLQAYSIPAVSNFALPTIIVNGKAIALPPPNNSSTPIVPITFTITATCTGTTVGVTCK